MGDGLNVAVFLGKGDRVINVLFNPRKFLEVVLDKLMGLGAGHVDPLGEAIVADPVNDPKVDRLSPPAHVTVNFSIRAQVEDPPGRAGVNVLTVFKVLLEVLIPRNVGKNPEFHLGIVGGEDLPAVMTRHKGLPDQAAFRKTDRDVLQVRVNGGKPAGLGQRL